MDVYQAGQINLTSGSDLVEGLGTRWLNYTAAGDVLHVDGNTYPIAEILANHKLRLEASYPGPTATQRRYSIARQPVVKTIADYIADTSQRIGEHLAQLDDSPLSYDGSLWQVDIKSRENVTGKIAEINSKQALGETVPLADLFWRDIANTTHTWSTVESYLAWLHGFVSTYGSRRTGIYRSAFDHKEALDAIATNTALTDAQKIDAIRNYDFTTGWS